MQTQEQGANLRQRMNQAMAEEKTHVPYVDDISSLKLL